MAKKIDAVGVYRGEVYETALQTSKNGNPMFVISIRADERYIEDAADIAHFKAHGVIETDEPQWIDWSAYDETARNYMTLFSPKAGEGFTEETATLNYKQVQTAFDWDGTSFDELASGKFDGHKVLFRVKEEEDPQYGPTTVCWVDAFDAPPQRELKSVKTDELAALNARLSLTKKKPAAKTAAAAPPKKAPAKAPAKKATKKTTPPAKAAPSTPAATAPAPPAPTAEETPVAAPVVEVTMEAAWEEVYTKAAAAGQEPNVIIEAWKDAITGIMQDLEVEEADFTGTHWAQVQKAVLHDLS